MARFYVIAVVGALLIAQVVGQSCACNDNPPPAGVGKTQYSCAQQKKWEKCSEGFMLGFCECTCERCCPCNDFPPPGDKFTCQQQKDFGKCDDKFMEGYCECTCDRCTNGGAPAPDTGCPGGQTLIFGSDKCETNRCAANRQQCANRCGGLEVIEFDCDDSGNSFSSSCACAGK
eukprot:TRINITY_DN178_c0_g1_i1.p1 TRINITY_DN178_c0_g1~~TRINITY_DN178_c0_g1_i1.p1  ORF type:complete len:174 (-),score=15.22 TRINITY_DN178_c0_g1_i1:645-1166(-)